MLLHEDILNKRFALLIENLHEGILVENEERRIILTNDAFCKMFGFSVEPHAMIGLDCSNAAEDVITSYSIHYTKLYDYFG